MNQDPTQLLKNSASTPDMGPAKNQTKNSRIIMHIDGDAFFAMCEVSRRPDLRGKPVIVGAEKGIATALSYEAKALGITRSMPIFHIKKYWPQVICLPADFELYTSMSMRMKIIMRRFVSKLEEYSVDECFADITDDVAHLQLHSESHSDLHSEPHSDSRTDLHPYISFAQKIQDTLESELGITYSIGIGSTKVRAKIASKQKKPRGITYLHDEAFTGLASKLSIGSVWGIGKSSIAHFAMRGISTVHDFLSMKESLVQEYFSKPHQELWHELHGRSVLQVETEHEIQKSFQHTRMFEKPCKSKDHILAELAYHTEIVCERARYHASEGKKVYWFLKTQGMQYIRDEFVLPRATTSPAECMSTIRKRFDTVFIPGLVYRSCGVTLANITPTNVQTGNLFFTEPQNTGVSGSSSTTGISVASSSSDEVYKVADTLQAKYGKRLVHLASSLKSSTYMRDAVRTEQTERFPLPYLGEVR